MTPRAPSGWWILPAALIGAALWAGVIWAAIAIFLSRPAPDPHPHTPTDEAH